METQIKQIREHLKRFKSITSWDAIKKYRATRLSAIIFRLREQGMNIESKRESGNGKQWVRYALKK